MIDSFAAAEQRLMENYNDLLADFQAIGLEEEFVRVATSPVLPERVSQLLELIYANEAELAANTKTVGADIGEFAALNGFYGLRENNRGAEMINTLKGSPPATPPEPKSRYVKPSPITPPTPE